MSCHYCNTLTNIHSSSLDFFVKIAADLLPRSYHNVLLINMNYVNDKKNMVVILIIIGILTVAAIGMLLAVPSILKSNTANLAGHSNNDTNDRNAIALRG